MCLRASPPRRREGDASRSTQAQLLALDMPKVADITATSVIAAIIINESNHTVIFLLLDVWYHTQNILSHTCGSALPDAFMERTEVWVSVCINIKLTPTQNTDRQLFSFFNLRVSGIKIFPVAVLVLFYKNHSLHKLGPHLLSLSFRSPPFVR